MNSSVWSEYFHIELFYERLKLLIIVIHKYIDLYIKLNQHKSVFFIFFKYFDSIKLFFLVQAY